MVQLEQPGGFPLATLHIVSRGEEVVRERVLKKISWQ